MPDFSSALNLTWQISAGEAAYINHQFIEKAHPDIFDLFLQVFDKGRMIKQEQKNREE